MRISCVIPSVEVFLIANFSLYDKNRNKTDHYSRSVRTVEQDKENHLQCLKTLRHVQDDTSSRTCRVLCRLKNHIMTDGEPTHSRERTSFFLSFSVLPAIIMWGDKRDKMFSNGFCVSCVSIEAKEWDPHTDPHREYPNDKNKKHVYTSLFVIVFSQGFIVSLWFFSFFHSLPYVNFASFLFQNRLFLSATALTAFFLLLNEN